MNDTTFSCSHSSNSHPFLSARKQSEMSKRSQESSSPGSPTAKAKARCLVSRQCESVGQDSSSNPKSMESTRDSQVWTWEERNAKSGWYSVQHASGNREYMRKLVQNMKDRLRHDESRSEIPMNSEKMLISIWTRSWLHRCRQHCAWTRVTKRIWKYSRIVNLRASKVCPVLQE